MPGRVYRFSDINKIVDGTESPEEVPMPRPEKPLSRLEMNKKRKQEEEAKNAHPDEPRSS